jgi:hypothetical protein
MAANTPVSPEFQNLVLRPGVETAGALIVSTIRRHPVRSITFLSSYVIGLGAALFFSGLSVSQQNYTRYDLAKPSSFLTENLVRAQREAHVANSQYISSQGWFGSCSTSYCQSLKTTFEEKAKIVSTLQLEYDTKMREAKKNLGIFSIYGVAEARDLFWSTYGWGKSMAQRMSFWDMMFSGLSMRRDEQFVEFAMRLAVKVFQNIIISTFAVCVSFATSIPKIIYSFSPSIPEAILFYFVAMCALLSTVLTCCVGCCGLTFGVPIALARMAPPGTFRVQRIEGGRLRTHYN